MFDIASIGVIGVYEGFAGWLVVVDGIIPQLRRFGDENAAVYQADGAGEDERIQKDLALIHQAVFVFIGENDHFTGGCVFSCPCCVGHIIHHLYDPYPAFFVEAEGDRSGYQGFGCDQLDGEAGVNVHL